LVEIVDQIRDPKTRNPSKIKLKDLTATQIWQILFYYLDTLPDPLCTGAKYDSFQELDSNYNGKDSPSEWREETSKLIGSLPGRQRMTLLRVAKTVHEMLSLSPEEKRKEVTNVSIDCLAPVFFSPAYPVEEEAENAASPSEPAPKESRLKRLRKKKAQQASNEPTSPRVHHPEGNHLPGTFSMLVNDLPQMEPILAKYPVV